jgi:hypothetical protein
MFFSLRSIATELPEDSWPQQKITNIERSELRLLMEAMKSCEERGMDCTELRHLALKHICFAVTQKPGAISELSAISEGLEGGMVELLGFLDRTVVALADEGFANLSTDSESLTALAAVLRSVVDVKGWHETLDPETTIKVARTACVATQWSALWGQRSSIEDSAVGRIVGMAPLDFAMEDQQNVVTGLVAVWRALAQDGPAKVLKSRTASSEAGDLRKDLQARYKTIGKQPEPPSFCKAPVLPAALKQPLAMALGSSAPVARPAPAKKITVEVIQQKPDEAAASGGWLITAIDTLRWTFIAAIAVGAVSQDGLGLLNFHVLPTPLKDLLCDIMRAQVAKVDMQLARTSPPKYLDELPVTQSITLGPNTRQELWGCDSTYIQPKFTGPAAPQN